MSEEKSMIEKAAEVMMESYHKGREVADKCATNPWSTDLFTTHCCTEGRVLEMRWLMPFDDEDDKRYNAIRGICNQAFMLGMHEVRCEKRQLEPRPLPQPVKISNGRYYNKVKYKRNSQGLREDIKYMEV